MNHHSNIIIFLITFVLMALMCVQKYLLNINFFLLFLYLLGVSFINYKSILRKNLLHLSWLSLTASAIIYFTDYTWQMISITIAPLSIVIHLFCEKKLKIFRWIQLLGMIIFSCSIWLYHIGETKNSSLLALSALLMRHIQFPFHLWIREIKFYRDIFPVLLYFVVIQSGFIIYAHRYLHLFDTGILYSFIPGLTLFTGLILSVYGLKEKENLTKHLLVIVSQSCLPLAAYHSFSTTSATGGILFAMVIAISGTVYGMFAYHFYVQKGVKFLDRYYSFYRSNKNLAAIYFVAGFSLVGLPFTVGYFAEDLLFHGLIETAPMLAPLYIIMAGINGYTVFFTFNKLFFGHDQNNWTSFYQTKLNKFFIGLATLILTVGIVGLNPYTSSLEKRLINLQKEHGLFLEHKQVKND